MLDNRKLYANLKRNDAGKKVVSFGKVWGTMKKARSNTECMKTGDGLWVLDIDTKDMSKMPKKLMKLLPTPTVETANGFHYYFKGEGIAQTQALIKLVDVRNEGGLVFTKYTGDDKNISYKKTGKIMKPSKELMKYLKDAQHTHAKADAKTLNLSYKEGKAWKQYKDGEQHSMLMATMIKMFNDRKSDDEVWSRAEEYMKTYLKDTRHERTLMEGRFKWAKSQVGDTKLKGKTLKVKKVKAKKAKKVKGCNGKTITIDCFKDLNKNKFDEKSISKMVDQKYMNYFPLGLHTIVYGASGTMKTTIVMNEVIEGLKSDKKLHCLFFSFDATNSHHKAIFQRAKAEGVGDRLSILHEATGEDLFDLIDNVTEKKMDARHTIIVVDTYKNITEDINTKGGNGKVLAKMRTFTRRNGTIITIGHSNKDGVAMSGTAELEQDTDGVLRFDYVEGVNGDEIHVTKGGRIRFDFSDKFYAVPMEPKGYGDIMNNIAEIPDSKNVSTANLSKNELRDMVNIKAIRECIDDGKVTLLPIREVTGLSRDVARRLLRTYEGVHWITDSVNDDGGTVYKSIKAIG